MESLALAGNPQFLEVDPGQICMGQNGGVEHMSRLDGFQRERPFRKAEGDDRSPADPVEAVRVSTDERKCARRNRKFPGCGS